MEERDDGGGLRGRELLAPGQQLWYLSMPHARIVDLIMVVEGHEGMAVTRVLEKKRGLVELLAAPDLAEDLLSVLEGLASDFPISFVERPEGISSIEDDPPA